MPIEPNTKVMNPEELLISKIKTIVVENKRADGWTDLAPLGNILLSKGIDYRDGGVKLRSFFEKFGQIFVLGNDDKSGLPIVRVAEEVSQSSPDVEAILPSYKKRNEDVHLKDWASINMVDAIQSLRSKALEESWSYGEVDARYPNPILAKYIKWTFIKLMRENKVIFARDKYAAFNTGLVDSFYKPIFAVFTRNRGPKKQPWYFVDFCVAGSSSIASRILSDNFPQLPERAVYIKNFDDVMYDCTLPVDGNWDHIILENVDRLPFDLISQVCYEIFDVRDPAGMTDEESKVYFSRLREVLEGNPARLSLISNMITMALEVAKNRVAWNYKTAIPIYYPTDDKVHLILPLALNLKEPEQISLALVMTKTPANRYRAVTIFTLDMAYSNARLVTRPSSEWLSADSICPDELSDNA